MHGFGIIISLKNEIHFPEFSWKKPFGFQSEFVKRKLEQKNFHAEQLTQNKFINEKLWIDSEKLFIVTEGIITNIAELCVKYSVKTKESLIELLADENEFFNPFRGNFCGFIYNKQKNTYIAFNNHSGTKKLFCYRDTNIAIICTDLQALTLTLKNFKTSFSHDIESAYLLLSSGFMMGNKTLVKEIQQVSAGEYAEIQSDKIDFKKYFQLSDITETTDSKSEIIRKVDFLFKQAVKREFEIDKKYGTTSVSTISGGLDSRMTALIAHKLGYNQILFNFSEKGYADQLIADEIAREHNLPLRFIPLNGDSMTNIDEVVAVNDGLTIYTGASHVFSAIKSFASENSGIIHTGILGDAIFGSYLKSIKPTAPEINDGSFSARLSHKTASLKNEIATKYAAEELYKFNTRAFHGINNGFLFFELAGESLSPFLDADLMQYALSIPRKFRYKERIYIEWIQKYYPDIAKFIWENIGGKPTNNNILRFLYRIKRAIIKRLPIQSMWKNNMNPEQLWYDSNSEVKLKLDNYFADNLHFSEFDKELMEDLISMYKTGNINEKTQVLTLLAAYKLLFS
jgi:asparagine synthase (glutamine-hydrolysing)